MKVQIKRVYDDPSNSDGRRILVDRLWPRGLSKDKAKIDVWLKDVAPSPELRKWFGHDPSKWKEFRAAYTEELNHNPAVNDLIRELQQHHATLVYGAKDPDHNHALVLKDFLERQA